MKRQHLTPEERKKRAAARARYKRALVKAHDKWLEDGQPKEGFTVLGQRQGVIREFDESFVLPIIGIRPPKPRGKKKQAKQTNLLEEECV